MIKNLSRLLVTGFSLGYLPASGSVSSAVFFLLWWWLVLYLSPLMAIIILALVVLAEIIATFLFQPYLTSRDPSCVVSDEIIASTMILMVLPHGWWWYALGWIVFRFFDITKTLGIKRLETVGGPPAIGIIIDDVLAAIYTMIIIVLIKLWL